MTPLFLGLVLFGVTVGVPLLNRLWVERAHRHLAQRIGRALGFRLVPRLFGRDALEGEVDSIPFRITWAPPRTRSNFHFDGRGDAYPASELEPPIARIVVDASHLIPRELSFESETLFGHFGKLITGSDVEIQDERFDADVLARGPAQTITALMDTKTRKLLRGVVSVVGARIANGKIEVASARLDDQRAIESLVATLVEIARAMEIDAQRSVPRRLLENVLRDPVPGVRQNNLSVLIADYRSTPEAEEAIAVACRDPDPGVAVLAASASGPEGFARLQELAAASSTSEAIRFVALRHLAKRAPTLAIPLLERGLDDVSPSVRHLAVETIGRLRHRPSLPRLIELCRHGDAALVVVAAGALGWMRGGKDDDDGPSIQALLELVGHPSPEVRASAARALGRLGTPAVIGALRPLTRRLSPGPVKQAAELAIEQIRARHGNPGAGRLSLVEDTRQGALSLDRELGALSRVETTHEKESV